MYCNRCRELLHYHGYQYESKHAVHVLPRRTWEIIRRYLLRSTYNNCGRQGLLAFRGRLGFWWCSCCSYFWFSVLWFLLYSSCVLCTQCCQFLWYFSLVTPVSFTNKTDRHDITEILLRVALSTITRSPPIIVALVYEVYRDPDTKIESTCSWL